MRWSWNCRGLANPWTFQDLYQLIKKVVFLVATLLTMSKIETMKRKLGFDECFSIKLVERSGGLALMWKFEINLSVHYFSLRHISGKVTVEGQQTIWLLTGYYGHPEVSKMTLSWELLSRLNQENSPWCIIGEFNEILV